MFIVIGVFCIQIKNRFIKMPNSQKHRGANPKDYAAFSEKNIEIQKGIKKLFDPNQILNPGKIF